jgi:hypothetical protein
VQRAECDLHQRAWRKEAQRASHGRVKRRNGAEPCRELFRRGWPLVAASASRLPLVAAAQFRGGCQAFSRRGEYLLSRG